MVDSGTLFKQSSFCFNCAFAVVLVALTANVAQAGPDTTTVLPQSFSVRSVADRLIGVMDTSAQASSNEKYPNVRMTTCEVKLIDRGSAPTTSLDIFLYQEQSLSPKLKPYRQRFLKISPALNGQAVSSLSFRPENPGIWIGFCDRPPTDQMVTTSQLGKFICSVIIKPVGEDYIGVTPVDGCPSRYRGATRITNRIRLHADGMDTWDRGFDQQGQQIWGADQEAYQFRRIRP